MSWSSSDDDALALDVGRVFLEAQRRAEAVIADARARAARMGSGRVLVGPPGEWPLGRELDRIETGLERSQQSLLDAFDVYVRDDGSATPAIDALLGITPWSPTALAVGPPPPGAPPATGPVVEERPGRGPGGTELDHGIDAAVYAAAWREPAYTLGGSGSPDGHGGDPAAVPVSFDEGVVAAPPDHAQPTFEVPVAGAAVGGDAVSQTLGGDHPVTSLVAGLVAPAWPAPAGPPIEVPGPGHAASSGALDRLPDQRRRAIILLTGVLAVLAILLVLVNTL